MSEPLHDEPESPLVATACQRLDVLAHECEDHHRRVQLRGYMRTYSVGFNLGSANNMLKKRDVVVAMRWARIRHPELVIDANNYSTHAVRVDIHPCVDQLGVAHRLAKATIRDAEFVSGETSPADIELDHYMQKVIIPYIIAILISVFLFVAILVITDKVSEALWVFFACVVSSSVVFTYYMVRSKSWAMLPQSLKWARYELQRAGVRDA